MKHSTVPFRESRYLHLPEVRFLHWCTKQYGINKGVLNTIDGWFYDAGVIPIPVRRLYVLAFLDFAKTPGKKGKIRFGHGGLTKKLHDFMDMQECAAKRQA
ncbi:MULTISPECIES: hypothetical protein [Bacillus]|uniref:RNA-binding riboflavin kinase RibR n=1 Tax=Bacillus velezensis TaxID=492670 RepID=A0A411A3C1_BACVE|nr:MULTISPECIES: hypothetical protein [Bacillus]APA01746.1 hypothetical protein BK055_03950 [Bacillus velezensis]ASB52089.1 RNA-binding riboflavin kinase RibR [Bacillus velezensis]ASB64255.1 RNA-binding riboflavin kinase RibR [Bacillus velezensis]ATY27409.1 hypothetical protein CVD07_03560 [Bacillus velezensis]AVB10443.1 hypothetical protein C3438_13560 [Bacillus velezensis]